MGQRSQIFVRFEKELGEKEIVARYFNDVLLKNRKNAIRVMMDRILTEEEKQEMKKNKHFMGVDCVAQYRHAPEIKKSYFYVV